MDAGDDLITLDEAAKMIPGADANTLKRMQRKGVLTCYRPGKAYLTTAADVREAVKRCEVGQKVRKPKQTPLGSTNMDLANAALDAALAGSAANSRSVPVRRQEFDAGLFQGGDDFDQLFSPGVRSPLKR